MVFSRTKHGANKIVKQLAKVQIKAEAIHGNKSQGARQRALENFKNRDTRVLIATDIAARGIDVDELELVINYDLPVLRKIYSWFDTDASIVDTLILSRLYHPNMMEIDKKRNIARMPLQLYGRHSLESYGYRLQEYKGEFGKTTDWQEWSQEMQDYCVQDVKVTTKLCEHFRPYLTGAR